MIEPSKRDMLKLLSITLLIAVLAPPQPAGAADDPAALDFFEKRIRPVLVDRCFECHSASSQKLKGELRLDSREAILKGGETGPAVETTKPGDSLLLRAIRYDDRDLQMPPNKKDRLSPQQVKDFETWIAAGAVFPASKPLAASEAPTPTAKTHWAFQPVSTPAPPKVEPKHKPITDIDRFIIAKLESSNLSLSPPVGKRTLIRRATFDLHGLPPTPQEVKSFIDDNSEDAFAKVIDRLLASPRYGERWGRYWLDLARYSDTKGYVYGDREERFFVHAHAYRDWVIRAFNADMPYDKFVLLQIAADQVVVNDDAPPPEAPSSSQAPSRQGGAATTSPTTSAPPLRDSATRHVAPHTAQQSDLAAMGFLTLGRRFLGVVHDVIDDRIDTLMRTTQGLTVACARCHDHKFDPIPTDDYYSLYGVFANTTERATPLTLAPPDTDAYRAFEKELRGREKKLRDALTAKRNEWSNRVRAQSTEYLLALLDTSKLWTEEFYAFISANEINPPFVRQWQSYLFRRDQAGFDTVFEPWHRLSKVRTEGFAHEAGAIIAELSAGQPPLNVRVADALSRKRLESMQDLAKMYGALLVEADKAWRELLKKDAKATALPEADLEAIRLVLYANDSPVLVPDRSVYEAEFFFEEGARVHLAKLQAQIDQWLISSGGATPHAVILDDIAAEHRKTARVFRRGNPATPGKEVPRQFLALLAGPQRKTFEHGAGRLDLASAIIDPKNPLTARVIVNRVWQHHFGRGLVATPSDFGTRAEPPTHPELLDHLASRLTAEGWSIKKLHRQIMMSAVYRQQGITGAEREATGAAASATRGASIDPNNHLLSHFPRQRLDFEATRDSLLFVSGGLDLSHAAPGGGGRPVDLFKQPFPTRRSVYGLVDRQFFPGELRIFDVASPDLHTPARPATTVPQQALFFMNSAFVRERAKALAKHSTRQRPATGGLPAERDFIHQLYENLFQRRPTERELALGLAFLDGAVAEETPAPHPAKIEPSPWTYGYGELDEKAGRLKSFTPLPHFTGDAWQGGSAWPDGKLGWVQITAAGGHAGNDLKHAAVRRFTAPRDMKIAIAGAVRHEFQPGDGIRAFLVHAPAQPKDTPTNGKVVGSWTMHNQSADTKVQTLEIKAGDTIDFIVDIRGNLNSDMFTWKVELKELNARASDASAAAMKRSWSSHAEFAGVVTAPPPGLTAAEMYAQTLMLSNEFLFVD